MLEVGAGYGRLLRSFLDLGIPFREYYGLDISEQNIEYLRKQFAHPAIHFMWADVEEASLPFRFDVGFSSLTFKHLYPSFKASLRNCTWYMNPGGPSSTLSRALRRTSSTRGEHMFGGIVGKKSWRF